jgi:hypothetical protein
VRRSPRKTFRDHVSGEYGNSFSIGCRRGENAASHFLWPMPTSCTLRDFAQARFRSGAQVPCGLVFECAALAPSMTVLLARCDALFLPPVPRREI